MSSQRVDDIQQGKIGVWRVFPGVENQHAGLESSIDWISRVAKEAVHPVVGSRIFPFENKTVLIALVIRPTMKVLITSSSLTPQVESSLKIP